MSEHSTLQCIGLLSMLEYISLFNNCQFCVRALHTIAINGCFNIGVSHSPWFFLFFGWTKIEEFPKDAAAATIAKQEGSSYSIFWLFGEKKDKWKRGFLPEINIYVLKSLVRNKTNEKEDFYPKLTDVSNSLVRKKTN